MVFKKKTHQHFSSILRYILHMDLTPDNIWIGIPHSPNIPIIFLQLPFMKIYTDVMDNPLINRNYFLLD